MPKIGFWHKGRMQAIPGSNRLNNPLESHGIVGSCQGVGILEVNFMLSLGNFVMRSFDLKTHFFEGLDDLATTVIASVIGIEREIPGDIIGDCGGTSIFILFKQEEFRFGSDIHGIAKFLGFSQNAF